MIEIYLALGIRIIPLIKITKKKMCEQPAK